MENYLDLAPCIYFSSTDEGTLVEVNETLCRLLGYEKNELLGNKAEIIFTVPTKIFQQTHFFPLLKMQGQAEEIFITLRCKNGLSLPVLINAERKCINETYRNIYIGIIVRQRQKFEEELIAAKRLAENALSENTALTEAKAQLQKHSEELEWQMRVVNIQNEELKQINRVVTHDMQEPLRKLSILSNMLIEDNERTDHKLLAGKICRVTVNMRDVLFGLQQYVWLNETPLHITRIDFLELIEAVTKELQKEFPAIELAVDINANKEFAGDWQQMRLLFYQLLSNAIRFRKNNKVHVYISTQTLQLNRFRNVEGRYNYVSFLRITVRDEGIGFNPEYKSQLFDLFKKLHSQSGRGIGLSLCKKVVGNHQGTITIDGKPEVGTTVTIDIPLTIGVYKGTEVETIIDHNLEKKE